MFDWLNDILQRFLDLIPQPVLILPNEGGVRCNCFPWVSWHRRLDPGWYIEWPLFQKIIRVEITPQVIDLRPQSVLTKDGHSMVVSGAVRYRVVNAEKAILAVQDFDDALIAVACGSIAQEIRSKVCAELMDFSGLKAGVRSDLAKESSGWGLKIESCYITDLDKSRSIRLLQNN